MTEETVDFFNMDWEWQNFTGLGLPYKPHAKYRIQKPQSFEWMKETASLLSKGIPFVRVDFYEAGGHPYFGELTFFPASGFGEFLPYVKNIELGNKILTYDVQH